MDYLRDHKITHILCNTCGREIIQAQDLEEHFHQDQSTGKFLCGKCNQQFCKFWKLVKHIRIHHNNDNAIDKCALCRELEATEPNGIGYVCCVCNIVFDVPRDLENHMFTHNMTNTE